MLSDINFDPFHDPAKFDQLRKAPVKKWLDILNQPDSPTRLTDFNKLQSACGAHGMDTPIELLESSLDAAHRTQPKPSFITVSGNLIGSSFECRYRTLAPNSFSPAAYSAFVSKTISFVAYRLWVTFPSSQVYIALGSNDSDCKAYDADPDSDFLRETANTITGRFTDPSTRYAILHDFPHYGGYNVELPRPMQKTRLIVLQDTFESPQHTTCGGAASPEAQALEHIDWLRSQLAAARKSHERVWIMAHIPPGVDTDATLKQTGDVCDGKSPVMFHRNSALLNAITDYGDVVKLTLFGHSHMDEWRVYKSTNAARPSSAFIPGKLIPSISPVDGNNPAFTLAQINADAATIRDYAVYSTDTPTGIKAMWKQEYRYSTAYNMPDFSGVSLAKLSAQLAADKAGTALTSIDYESYFYPGDRGNHKNYMQKEWLSYACSTQQDTAESFRSCACPNTTVGVSNPPADTATGIGQAR